MVFRYFLYLLSLSIFPAFPSASFLRCETVPVNPGQQANHSSWIFINYYRNEYIPASTPCILIKLKLENAHCSSSLTVNSGMLSCGYNSNVRMQPACDRTQAAYDRIRPACDRMQAAYDRTPPAYDRNMQPAYERMHPAYSRIQPAYTHTLVCGLHTQAAFYDLMQAACIPSVAPA